MALADQLEQIYRTRISKATARKLIADACSRQLGEPVSRLDIRREVLHQFSGMRTILRILIGASLLAPTSILAFTLSEPFADFYSVRDLGSVPGVPTRLGGTTFKAGDPNTLLVGGNANQSNGQLYEIAVVRDENGRIVGFDGTAAPYAEAAFNDGGVAYGPDGVLFLSQWPENRLAQILPGEIVPAKVIELAPLGVAQSNAAVNFVPFGLPGAGQMKLVSWSGGQFYTANLAPDGNGTFDIISVTLETTLPGGPEGFAWLSAGSPGFDQPSMLVSEWSANRVSAYQVDGNGNPIAETRQLFLSGLDGALGASIDPLTGDFVFSTFDGGDRIVVVSGFSVPPIPEPNALILWLSGSLMTIILLHRARP